MAQQTMGGCQCGAVRYAYEGESREVTVCHCRDCQRQSGSAFGMSLFVPPERFRLVQGRPVTFEVLCDSGRTKTCAFSPACGTRIYHQGQGGISIKAGTLDDTSGLRPTPHYWTDRKQGWVQIPEGVSSFPDDG